jgi:lipid-A-disaccharide synthase
MRKTLLASGFDPESELTGEPARRSMARSRALLVASGTATLEAALVGRPFAVLYRTGRVNYALARRLVRVRHIALVNLVAGEDVVREYIQEAAHPEALEREIARLLGDAGERARQVERLAQVRSRLGEPGASRRVAELALAVAAGPRAGAGVP